MEAINPDVGPSGEGCAECLASGGWWIHLRRCAQCGHVGCCDSSLSKHASKHAAECGHPIAQSFEPGEDWFWDYVRNEVVDGPVLKAPTSRPLSQAVPGPQGKVPSNWHALLS
jgi:hypothetical protein